MQLASTLFLSLIAVTACSSSSATGDDDDDDTSSGGPVADQCPTPTGEGTKVLASPSADTTWSAEGSPYLVGGTLSIPAGVTLTLDPCTVVRLDEGVNVTVAGALIAKGVPGKGVRFEPNEAGKPWGGIDSANATKRTLDLAYTTLRGGGTKLDRAYYTLRVRGNPNEVPRVDAIRVDHVTVEDSASVGVEVIEGAGFSADSTDLTITGSGFVPLVVTGNGLSEVPTGSYTGNGTDSIDVDTWLAVLTGAKGESISVTMKERGVPYRIGAQEGAGELAIGSDREGAAPTKLTIEPGVTVRMRKDGILRLQGIERAKPALGALIAVGTASAPVTFTSDQAAPAAGDWKGIWLEAGAPADLRIENAVVQYAGAPATTNGYSCGTPDGDSVDLSNQGAIVIASETPLTTSFVRSTTISDSATNGIDRGWTGDDVDFTASNTFTNIAACTQTQQKPASGSCPEHPSCPTAD